MRHARIISGIVPILLLAALTFSACGGGDDDNGGSNTNAATATHAGASTTAAGGGSTETAAPNNNGGGSNLDDPCALLTKDEVASALGGEIIEPSPIVIGSQAVSGSLTATVSNCSYTSSEGIDSVSVDIWAAPGNSGGIKTMTQLICTSKESADVGDEACWYDSEHSELQLSSGGYFLDFNGTGTGKDALIDLAKKAIDRLP